MSKVVVKFFEDSVAGDKIRRGTASYDERTFTLGNNRETIARLIVASLGSPLQIIRSGESVIEVEASRPHRLSRLTKFVRRAYIEIGAGPHEAALLKTLIETIAKDERPLSA